MRPSNKAWELKDATKRVWCRSPTVHEAYMLMACIGSILYYDILYTMCGSKLTLTHLLVLASPQVWY